MSSDSNNTSKGCFSWAKGIGAGLLGLLTAAASCAGIMQYFQAGAATPVPSPNPVSVVVVTSVPVSNASNAGNVQANVATASPEQQKIIEGFLQSAVAAEITAYQYGDASYATMFAKDALLALQNQIMDLNTKGIFLDAQFDYNTSYIHDIRFTANKQIEVDWCEYWAQNLYERQTGNLISSYGRTLIPETIVMEYLGNNFYITKVYSNQTFCS